MKQKEKLKSNLRIYTDKETNEKIRQILIKSIAEYIYSNKDFRNAMDNKKEVV